MVLGYSFWSRLLALLREEFTISKLTLHSYLGRRAVSRRALPCPSSFEMYTVNRERLVIINIVICACKLVVKVKLFSTTTRVSTVHIASALSTVGDRAFPIAGGTVVYRTSLLLHLSNFRSLKSHLFRPPVYGSNGRSYKMLVMFFFSFATRSPRSLGRSPRNFAARSETGWIE